MKSSYFRNRTGAVLVGIVAFLASTSFYTHVVYAEGSKELSPVNGSGDYLQWLDLAPNDISHVKLYVRINEDTETIKFTASNKDISVIATFIGNASTPETPTLQANEDYSPQNLGVYEITFNWKNSTQTVKEKNDILKTYKWDISVLDSNNEEKKGRLYAEKWYLQGISVQKKERYSWSVYSRISTQEPPLSGTLKSPPKSSVVRFDMQGILNSGSTLLTENSGLVKSKIDSATFLSPPEFSTYDTLTDLLGQPTVEVLHDDTQCSTNIVVGENNKVVVKNYPLKDISVICKKDSSDGYVPGNIFKLEESVSSDGTRTFKLNAASDELTAGTHDCRVETHLTASLALFDFEVLNPGLRMFEVGNIPAKRTHTPLDMSWDDSTLESDQNNIKYSIGNGEYVPIEYNNLSSAPIADSFKICTTQSVPCNARGWGDINDPSVSVGDSKTVITETNVVKNIGFTILVEKTGKPIDSDADGLPDVIECKIGSDPKNADTDGDGVKDGEECTTQYYHTNNGECPDTNNDHTPDWKQKCGDGRAADDEECDDGNDDDNDGCSNSCKIKVGYKCPEKTTCYEDPCLKNPDICGENSVCTYVHPGKHKCSCIDNYVLYNDQCYENKCLTGNHGCDTNATCSYVEHGDNLCTCNTGFVESNGQCFEDKCKTGTHTCDRNATCTNAPDGNFNCTCNTGFVESNGQCFEDKCKTGTHTCDRNATCTYAPDGNFNCTCNTGFVENNGKCDKNICITDPNVCGDHASCEYVSDLNYKCNCDTGYVDKNGTCVEDVPIEIPDSESYHLRGTRLGCSTTPTVPPFYLILMAIFGIGLQRRRCRKKNDSWA